jgi:hypothetical protein
MLVPLEVIMPDDREYSPGVLLSLNAAFQLAWKCALIALGGLVLLGLASPKKDAPPPDLEGQGTGRAILREDGAIVRVSLDVPRDELSSCLVVEDRQGREVAVVHLFANGAFNLETGPEAPVKAGVHAKLDGALGIGVRAKGQRAALVLGVTPDGRSEFEVQDGAPNKVLEHVDITTEGKTQRRPVGPEPAEVRRVAMVDKPAPPGGP